jgi:hypothetical protein
MSEGDWQNSFGALDQPSHAAMERSHQGAVEFKNKWHHPLRRWLLRSTFSLEVPAQSFGHARLGSCKATQRVPAGSGRISRHDRRGLLVVSGGP